MEQARRRRRGRSVAEGALGAAAAGVAAGAERGSDCASLRVDQQPAWPFTAGC
jgi:hypothetical protein